MPSPAQAKPYKAVVDVSAAVAAASRISANPPAKPAKDEPEYFIPVVATQHGFYKQMRRAPGDKFSISSKEQLGSWMKKI